MLAYGPVSPGGPRWLRLRPADPWDVVLLVLLPLGILMTVLRHVLAPSGMMEGWGGIALTTLLYTHGSTPILSFAALTIYLLRWGRTMGRDRAYVWGGFALTLPLWFLAGLPLSVRGAGDITWIVVPWNLAAAGLMLLGSRRTLRRPAPRDA